MKSKKNYIILAILVAMVVIPDIAFANNTSSDGGEAIFGGILTMLIGFCQGTLGKLIAILAFLVGIIAGVAKGNFLAVLTGFGFAITMYYGPQAILSFFGASI